MPAPKKTDPTPTVQPTLPVEALPEPPVDEAAQAASRAKLDELANMQSGQITGELLVAEDRTDEIVARTSDAVMERLAPMLENWFQTITRHARQERLDEPPEAPSADGPTGEIADEDVDYIARSLTHAQFDRLVAVRRAGSDRAKWKELGAIPGEHLVAAESVKITYDGKPRNVIEGEVLEIAKLEASEVAHLRAKRLLVGPGEVSPR